MLQLKSVSSALISVFYKTGLEELVRHLIEHNVRLYATGGTYEFISKLGLEVTAVEDVTQYPSILGGRVKTLHPKVFGGILNRRENDSDRSDCERFEIPSLDLVVVDLYPFEETLASGASNQEIIEKIDIGGVSLIRAAAKNHGDVVVLPSTEYYREFKSEMVKHQGKTSLDFRRRMAGIAFGITSRYDAAIGDWIRSDAQEQLMIHQGPARVLRYGENPHQKGVFYGPLDAVFEQLSGKELSYNNLLDIDSAIDLISDFNEPVTAVLKHNNACGVSSGPDPKMNWHRALEADPVSAFGGIIVTTSAVDAEIATEIGKLFFEVLIAPEFSDEALDVLKSKKNRILLLLKSIPKPAQRVRTALNGYLWQSSDNSVETESDLKTVTNLEPTAREKADLLFANKLVKHARSNTIVLAKDGRLIASGVGQTSRVDALNQAIDKASRFGFSLAGAVMASDAFFPFPDCVEIAFQAGIRAVIQPGGSVKDQDSIDFCNDHNLSMVFTGIRHFRH